MSFYRVEEASRTAFIQFRKDGRETAVRFNTSKQINFEEDTRFKFRNIAGNPDSASDLRLLRAFVFYSLQEEMSAAKKPWDLNLAGVFIDDECALDIRELTAMFTLSIVLALRVYTPAIRKNIDDAAGVVEKKAKSQQPKT